MNARKSTLSGLAFASILIAGLAIPAHASAAETGTLKNNTNYTIFYQTGYADAKGFITWSSFTLAPGASHTWTVQNPQTHPLHLRWDLTIEDEKFVPTQSRLATRPNGFLTGFFVTGRQIWIDVSGGAR